MSFDNERREWRESLLEKMHQETINEIKGKVVGLLQDMGSKGECIIRYIESLETENEKLRMEKKERKDDAISLVTDIHSMAQETILVKMSKGKGYEQEIKMD